MNLETACNNFLTQIYKHFGVSDTEWRKCMYYFKSGKNKGLCCQERALDNGYCKAHQKCVTPVLEQTLESVTKKKANVCKAKSDIEQWLNTAVPQGRTVLRRWNDYLVSDDSELVFTDDDNYMVIGRLSKERIIKLTSSEVSVCETKGWKYDINAVIAAEEE